MLVFSIIAYVVSILGVGLALVQRAAPIRLRFVLFLLSLCLPVIDSIGRLMNLELQPIIASELIAVIILSRVAVRTMGFGQETS